MHPHSLLTPLWCLCPFSLSRATASLNPHFFLLLHPWRENKDWAEEAKSTATVNRQSLITAGRGRTVQAESGRGLTICQLPLSNWRMAGLIAMEAICVCVCVCLHAIFYWQSMSECVQMQANYQGKKACQWKRCQRPVGLTRAHQRPYGPCKSYNRHERTGTQCCCSRFPS